MKQIVLHGVMFFNLLIISLFLVIMSSCKSDRAVDGFDLLLDSGSLGRVDSTRMLTDSEIGFSDTLAATGSQSLLSLGSLNGIETRIVMRFGSVSDTLEIAKATLLLNTNTLLSVGRTKSKFDVIVRKVGTSWDEGQVNFDNFSFDTTQVLARSEIKSTVGSSNVADSTFSETVRFEFNETGLELVRNWADPASADTHGILIDFDTSDFVKDFFSSEGLLNRPRLELYLSKNGAVVDTVLSEPTADAFLFNRTFEPAQDGLLHVDNLFGRQVMVKFNLDSIPRESTINRANLILHVDEDRSVLTSSGFTLQIDQLSEFDTATNTAVRDSVLSPRFSLVRRGGSVVTMSVRNEIQFWVTGEFVNQGLLLRGAAFGRDISSVAFHSKNTNPELAPRLEIEFSSLEQ